MINHHQHHQQQHITIITTTRVASVENFDLPLMAFGPKLVKLELTNCTNFQSGTALNIRKYSHASHAHSCYFVNKVFQFAFQVLHKSRESSARGECHLNIFFLFSWPQVDSTDGNSSAGLQEAMAEQNLHTLQNQVNMILFRGGNDGYADVVAELNDEGDGVGVDEVCR